MTEKINFTMAALAKLKRPTSGRRYVYDQKIPGLVFCLTVAGNASFYSYQRFQGRPRRVMIGKFPDINVDTARDLATKLNADKANRLNPADRKRKERGELTLVKLWELYLEFHVPVHKKPRSVVEDRGLWKRYLSTWENRKLSSITSGDVQSHHARIGKANGKYAANRMLSLLSTMFTVAKKHGEWKTDNPCKGVDPFKEKSRDRFLQPEELPRFLAALEVEPNQSAADAFRLMLLTGARKMNVFAMRWLELDLSSATWRIPDTKQGEPQRVHLPAEAVSVLKGRKLANDTKDKDNRSPFVFPARTADTSTGHMTDATKAWRSVCAAAELSELRMHDLRRTLGSWQAAGGASLQVIGKSLGHKNTATTEIYARLNIDPVRESVDKAVAAMMASGKPADESKAVASDGTAN